MSHSSFGSVFCDEIMLSGFGRNLSSLTLKSCKNIDLADLAPNYRQNLLDERISNADPSRPFLAVSQEADGSDLSRSFLIAHIRMQETGAH